MGKDENMVDDILSKKGELDKFVAQVLTKYIDANVYPGLDARSRMYNIINDEVRGKMDYVSPSANKAQQLNDARGLGQESWMQYAQDDARYFECATSKYFNKNEVTGAIYLNLPDYESRLTLYKKLIEEYSQMPNTYPYNFKFITADSPDTRKDNFLIYVQNGELENVCDVLRRTLGNCRELVSKLGEPAKSLLSYEDLFSYQPRTTESHTRKFVDSMFWAIDNALCSYLGDTSINKLLKNRKSNLYQDILFVIRAQMEETVESPKKQETLSQSEREAIANLYFALANQKLYARSSAAVPAM